MHKSTSQRIMKMFNKETAEGMKSREKHSRIKESLSYMDPHTHL